MYYQKNLNLQKTHFLVFSALVFFFFISSAGFVSAQAQNEENRALIGGSLNVEPEEATEGDDVRYIVEYKNHSDVTVEDISFSVYLPESIMFVAQDSAFSESRPGEYVFREDSLKSGESKTVILNAKIANTINSQKNLLTTMSIQYNNPNTGVARKDNARVSLTANPATVAGQERQEERASNGAVSNLLAGGGIPFLPNSLVEWLILFLVLVIFVLILRQLYALYDEKKREKQARSEADKQMQQVRERMNENLQRDQGNQAPYGYYVGGVENQAQNPEPASNVAYSGESQETPESYAPSQNEETPMAAAAPWTPLSARQDNGYDVNSYGQASGFDHSQQGIPYADSSDFSDAAAQTTNQPTTAAQNPGAVGFDGGIPQQSTQNSQHQSHQNQQMPMMAPFGQVQNFGMPFNMYAQMQQMQYMQYMQYLQQMQQMQQMYGMGMQGQAPQDPYGGYNPYQNFGAQPFPGPAPYAQPFPGNPYAPQGSQGSQALGGGPAPENGYSPEAETPEDWYNDAPEAQGPESDQLPR